MYEAFFGMTGTPFARNIPPEQLYENRSLREILGRLMYVADKKLFAVVTSDPGCGKSTLLRRFEAMLPKEKYILLYLSDSKLTPKWFYKGLLEQLGMESGFYRGDAKKQLQQAIEVIQGVQKRCVVCVLDEAHLLDKEIFRERLERNLAEKNRQFVKLYDSEPISIDDIFEEYYEYGQQIKQYVTDTSVILNDALDNGKRVLFEGAQGGMLDIDQGTYPFVTSSNPVAGGVTIGSGVGPSKIDKVVGVCKAYTSRVGDGPFPTELFDEGGERIREVGHEYGTTTGRPRRVGWFDSVVMRHSRRVSGITNLSLNCIDVLSGLDTVKICVAYDLDGERIDHYPASLEQLKRCKPIYEELPGWEEDITGCRSLDELPENARNYVRRVGELVGVRISTFSVGPGREQTNILESVWSNI